MTSCAGCGRPSDRSRSTACSECGTLARHTVVNTCESASATDSVAVAKHVTRHLVESLSVQASPIPTLTQARPRARLRSRPARVSGVPLAGPVEKPTVRAEVVVRLYPPGDSGERLCVTEDAGGGIVDLGIQHAGDSRDDD